MCPARFTGESVRFDQKPVEKEETEAPKEQKKKPLEKMTATELKEIARKIPDITGATSMKKEQLIAVIKEASGVKEEKPIIKRKKAAPKQEVNIKELKQKIIQFKEEKAAARAVRDRQKVDILRRRINRLKKQTRKVGQA